MDLRDFLKSYEMNLKYFDLETFEDEIMDIPYQIKMLKRHLKDLNEKDKKMFFYLNEKLKKIINNTKPKNKLQEKIILEIKSVL